MQLSFKDRVIMSLLLLPKESNITDQIICKDIAKKIEISQEERELVNLTTSERGGLTWEPTKEPAPREIEFSAAELDLLRKSVTKLDEEKKVSADILDLCLMIRDSGN